MVAHVAADLDEVALDGIVHGHDVERVHLVALSDEVAREVQAEEACTSGDGVNGYLETVTACAGRGAGCGGGFESTRTAAARRTAIPIVASPTRLRDSFATTG